MKKVNNSLQIVGGFFILLAVAIVFGNIVCRSLFGIQLQGSYEMTGLCAVLFVSVSIPACTLSKKHIRVELVIRLLGKAPRFGAEVVACAIDAIVGVVLTYGGYRLALNMLNVGESTATLSLPEGPFRMIWAIGAALIVVFSIINIIREIRAYHREKGVTTDA